MAKGNNQPKQRQNDIYNRSVEQYNKSQSPSDTENEFAGASQNFMNNYNTAATRNMADYGNIMGGYQDMMKNMPGATKFSWDRVNADRPAELGESYDTLRSALPGYREFAETGGYSPTDVQELRARGTSPIRAAYGNANMQLDRTRALGSGGANYAAAAAKMARESGYGMSDAMTNVNAQLAQDIRQGRLAGLAGVSGIGSEMGGLSSQEAARMLQANMANSQGALQAAGMGEESLQNSIRNKFGALQGMTGLYGTTPGMASTFGNQALNAYGQRFGAESDRLNRGMNSVTQQSNINSPELQHELNKQPWWKQALQMGTNAVAGAMIPGAGFGIGSMFKRGVKPTLTDMPWSDA